MTPPAHSRMAAQGENTASTMAALRILLLLLASASSPAVRGAAVPAKTADHVDVHIVGGRDALHGEFPHHVSVQAVPPGWLWYEGDPVHFCGGTLVTARWVLTAAQCTELPWGTKRVEVAVGISDLDLDHALPSGSQRIVVTKMISHEDYDHSYNLGIVPNDIALLKLADLVQLSSTVKLALLPSPGAIPTGDAVLAGWGSTSTDGNFPRYPDKLQMATFPIVDFQTCYDFVAELASSEPVNTLADTNICTGPLDMAGLAFCKGDSGSALIQGKGDETVVIGIVSWGAEHCGAKPRPSVYTRTSAFINWIETTQKNN